ncbi:uncharacterized protein LOC110461231 [Mizuhopecten yessoensis]|uniref:uncharacterized protein LOC110461231 n=1 Tax=Mizuhopecten yessoensis TaxID=6573 RepID=UPI000B45C367|nr:uncharacterized protein LOC110461231 [Mizuhopecten yessoensis]
MSLIVSQYIYPPSAGMIALCFSALETEGHLAISRRTQTATMLTRRVIHPAVVVTILVSLTTSSDNCDHTSIGSHPECQPTWCSCEKEREQYEPPLSCTAWYKDEWSRCFHVASPGTAVPAGVMSSVPSVTGVFLSSSDKSGQRIPLLNIDISQPTDDKYDMIQLLLRSTREVSDEYYVDTYYEKFPSWTRKRFPAPDTKAPVRKMLSFRSSFGNLDTCNVRCDWGKCEVSLNLYLLTITIFSSERQNLPGQSITYQVTSYNRRFLQDAKDSQWKPIIMTAVLRNDRGIHVVFEPLPSRFVNENTFYVITLQDWETWELKRNTTIRHNKADAYYGCIFDFNESSGIYEVMIQYKNCYRCPFETWVKSADFTLPEYPDEYKAVRPKISIQPKRRYTEIQILVTIFTVLLLAIIVFFCRRKIKARLQRDTRPSVEALFQNNNNNNNNNANERTVLPSGNQNAPLNQRRESKDSIRTRLEKLNYPNGYMDDEVLNLCVS